MWRVFGRNTLNGYGTTETGGLMNNNTVNTGVEVRLRDIPELGFTTGDQPFPRGEVLASSGRMSPGYFDAAHYSKSGQVSFPSDQDGWVMIGGIRYFCTGDIGELHGKGDVRIIGRCASVFKLSQGVFVSPEFVERVLALSPFVRQLFVYGDGTMSNVSVVVVPSSELVHRAQRASISEVIADPTAPLALVIESFRALAKEHSLKAWETPTRVLFTEEFTTENGLLAALGKISRPALIRRFGPQLTQQAGGLRTQASTETDASLAASTTFLARGLAAILAQVTQRPPESFRPDETLEQLALDSLAIARLSSMLFKRFGVKLAPRVLYALNSLSEVESALFGSDAVVRKGVMRASKVVDWNAEASEQLDLLQSFVSSAPPLFSSVDAADVVLTGATGFLGAFLLRQLVEKIEEAGAGPAKVVCLIRASSNTEARARLTKEMEYYELWNELVSARTVAIAADLSTPMFGLDTDVFQALRRTAKAIIHAAAHVDFSLPYSCLRSANVVGTRHVLEFAMAATPHLQVTHISTMGVLPPQYPESLVVPSDGLAARGGYAQSKWVAEHLVAMAIDKLGLAACIVRPGDVSGHSITGASNPRDAVTRLLVGLIHLGCVSVPALQSVAGTLNMCPVDTVARQIIDTPFTTASVRHLSGSRDLSLSVLCDWIRAAGYHLQDVPPGVFRSKLTEIDDSQPLFPFKMSLLASDARVSEGSVDTVVPPLVVADPHGVSAETLGSALQFLRRRGMIDHGHGGHGSPEQSGQEDCRLESRA